MSNKRFSRVLSGLMAVIMLFSLMPLNVLAADAEAADVTVTVTCEGAAVSGAAVSVADGISATTDDEGKAVLSGLTVGESYTASVTCENFAPAQVEFTCDDATVAGGIAAELKALVNVSVTVTCGDAAVSGATVSVSDTISATTDKNGAATLTGLTKGDTYTVFVACEGYASREQKITCGATDENVVKIAVEAYTRVSVYGTVVCEGASVAGAMVMLSGIGATALTGADGKFSFENVYQELVGELTVTCDHYVSKTVSDIVFGEENEISLEKEIYEITASADPADAEGCSATVESSSVAYQGNAVVTIKAGNDFSIYYITDNGMKVAEDCYGKTEYSYEIKNVSANHAVKVYFADETKVVEFEVDAEGNVYQKDDKDNSNQVDIATILGLAVEKNEDNGEISVNYTPAKNYRVFQAEIDGNAEDFNVNDQSFEDEFNSDELEKPDDRRSYIIKVRLNQYSITVPEDNVTTDSETVSYDRNATFTITPPEGQYLSSLKIGNTEDNAVEVISGVVYTGEQITYTLKNIQEDKVVLAEFAAIEAAEKAAALTIESSNAIDTPDSALIDGWDVIYLYNADDAGVTIRPSAVGAAISRDPNGSYTTELVIKDTEEIEIVYICHDGIVESVAANVKAVKDKTDPVISGAERTEVKETYYFFGIPHEKVVGINWNIDVSDDADSSGINRVVYSDSDKLNEAQIVALDEKHEAKLDETTGKYIASFGKNNKKTYYFWAIDNAGNISKCSNYEVDTDIDAPVIDAFAVDGIVSYETGNYAVPDGATFSVRCRDDLSNVVSVVVYVGEETFTLKQNDGDRGVLWTGTADKVAEGEVSVEVRDDSGAALDANGNAVGNVATAELLSMNSETLSSNILTIENVAPVVTYVEAPAAIYGNWYSKDEGEVTFKVTIEDAGVGLKLDDKGNVVMSASEGVEVATDSVVKETVTVTSTSTDETTGEETTISAEKETGKITGATVTLTVKGNDDVASAFDISFAVEDKLGNKLTYGSENCNALMFNIDGADPVIEKFDIAGNHRIINADGEEVVESSTHEFVMSDTPSGYQYHFIDASTVTVYASDVGSGVKDIFAYTIHLDENGDQIFTVIDKSEDVAYDTEAGLWKADYTIREGFKGRIFAYATDNVENTNQAENIGEDAHPSGLTTETQVQHNESEQHIAITAEGAVGTDEEGNPIYTMLQYETDENGNEVQILNEDGIPVEVKVTDTFNGIQSISYKIIYPENDATEVVVALDEENSGWTVESQDINLNTVITGVIPVAEEYNNIEIRVTMRDMAGNQSVESFFLSIDNTEPAIEVAHIIPTGDVKEDAPTVGETITQKGSTPYFVGYGDDVTNELDAYPIYDGSTLQIKIAERNLDETKLVKTVLKLLATADLKVVEIQDLQDQLKVFGPFYDDENGDRQDADYPYVEEVYYLIELRDCTEEAAGGTYETYFKAIDLTGLECEVSEKFVIDEIAPAVSIAFDNNDVKNGKYYNAERVATITVVERNFNNESGTVTGNASDDGRVFDFPNLGGWTDSKDGMTHTTTVSFTSDGLYQNFLVEYTDLAGATGSATADEFYVDTTMPEITITGVEDKSANNGTVAPSITYTDTNLDLQSVEITLTGANNGLVEYSAVKTNVKNGENFLYEDFDHLKDVDDIYTLYVRAVDMAGNEMTQTIQFSCNRFGSVFDLSGLQDMLGKYNQEERTIVVTETNVDEIDLSTVRITLTKNGTPTDLVQGIDFTIEKLGGEGTWSQYTYTIKSELFADDGTYSLYFYTEDAAGNINENIDDTKEAQISFGIDKTKPIVAPVDFQSGVQYAVESKTVAIEIKDNLLLDSVVIKLNGQEVSYTVEGDSYIFTIPKSNNKQKVEIVAVDAAGNQETIYVEEFLVTTNIFARWYNNTPLFIGSLVLLAVILGIAGWRIYIILFKKDDDEEEEQS